MANVVRAALLQTEWTGDKDSMIKKHEDYARQAAEQGAQVMCFQEVFYSPYFCQVQENEHFDDAEPIPDGPTTQAMQALAKETGMVLVLPMFEMEQEGFYYNTAAVIDADGNYLGKYRKTHIPHVKGFWEKFYFRPGNTGYPIFDTKVGRIGVYICYDRHFPEGWRALGLKGAKVVFNPSATSRGLSMYLWNLEQPAAAVANEYSWGRSTGWAKSPSATTTSTGRRTSSIPAAKRSVMRPRTQMRSSSSAISISTWLKRSARPGPFTATVAPMPTETS
jgi:N-carbamoylputrescine amidase